MAEDIAEEVATIIQRTTKGNNTNIGDDDANKIIDSITTRLEQMFEFKLEELTGNATSLKITDKTALTQIIADRVQLTLAGPMGQMTKEAQTAFDTATNIVEKCKGMMEDIEEAKERLGDITYKLQKLTKSTLPDGDEGGKTYEGWDHYTNELDATINQHGEIQASFAETLWIGAEKRAEKVASVAAGNILRAPHAQAIRDAKNAAHKFVIREAESDIEGLHWLEALSEKELVQAANNALEQSGIEGARNGHSSTQFVSAKCIPGGALLYISTEEDAKWLKQHPNMTNWIEEWDEKIKVTYNVYETIVEFVPVTVALEEQAILTTIELANALAENTIKPADKRHSKQKVAHAILSFSTPEAANHAIQNGLIIHGSSLEVRKSLPEPRLCNKCQRPGHFAKECKNKIDVCGRFARPHCTSDCTATIEELLCATCKTHGHGASSHNCPAYLQRSLALLQRRPECRYRLFIADNPETWTANHTAQQQPQPQTRDDSWDDAWRKEVRDRDQGWQQVQRRGNGRLAGGARGEGGSRGGYYQGTMRATTNTHNRTQQPEDFGRQQTLDGFLTPQGTGTSRGRPPENNPPRNNINTTNHNFNFDLDFGHSQSDPNMTLLQALRIRDEQMLANNENRNNGTNNATGSQTGNNTPRPPTALTQNRPTPPTCRNSDGHHSE
ncbi:hypothetical protein BDP27DRAFT_1432110 [Rhodocollybia butyracea]|uniref:CCHC-type domain-containing protein n=1 Tax=Rhodocollybia butyracea TaxID=206335 RepID=A0A9P5P8S9_9AGAR|nr:hypothetical protein BDP27DRAFT_1432110 [Rhodocollybia butyracea]